MKTIKVWDLFVRFFHWSLVIAVISQLATAEDFKTVHVKIGYFIIALLVSRILWGFVGTRYARFKEFIYPPADVLAYLKDLIQGHPKRYIGHNPAGGAMVCALLSFLLLTTLSGLLTYAAHSKGPPALQTGQMVTRAWAHDSNHRDEDTPSPHDKFNNNREQRHGHADTEARINFWKEIHESLVGITLSFIVLHVCGVIASSYVHRENLILAMITGKKHPIGPSASKGKD